MDVTKYTKSGKWISAADLSENVHYPLIIEEVNEWSGQNERGEKKAWPVLRFKGIERAFGLGTKKNLMMCVHNFGSTETDDWVGRKIMLYRTVDTFHGKLVPCVRILPKEQMASPGTPAARLDDGITEPDPTTPKPDEFSDDDIPF